MQATAVTASPTFQVRILSVRYAAQSILAFELGPLSPADELPPFSAGAHIDLYLTVEGKTLIRSYSLLNNPEERHRYCIGVNKDANSRGGSRHVHEALRAGDIITISAPHNSFPLNESAKHNVFIAGGIGITPILSMIKRSQALGIPWTLHYATRSPEAAAFLDLLSSEAGASGGTVEYYHDQIDTPRRVDMAAVTAAIAPDNDVHVYCCGPIPMLEAYEAATSHLSPERVHKEYFAAKGAPDTSGGYTVELARRGESFEVQEGQSILNCLIALNVDHPYSCGEGVCGTCEVRVLAGEVEHRDVVLSDAEKAANDRMMVCCSGARSHKLVLDL